MEFWPSLIEDLQKRQGCTLGPGFVVPSPPLHGPWQRPERLCPRCCLPCPARRYMTRLGLFGFKDASEMIDLLSK